MLVGSKDAEPQLVLGLGGGGGEMWASLGASEGRERKHLAFWGAGENASRQEALKEGERWGVGKQTGKQKLFQVRK